jgi:hypothetical protein
MTIAIGGNLAKPGDAGNRIGCGRAAMRTD